MLLWTGGRETPHRAETPVLLEGNPFGLGSRRNPGFLSMGPGFSPVRCERPSARCLLAAVLSCLAPVGWYWAMCIAYTLGKR